MDKLLIRGVTPIAIVDSTDVALSEGQSLISYPPEVTLDQMSEGFVQALLNDGFDAARIYLTVPQYRHEISLWRFRKRFTFEQRVSIETARHTDPVIETLMKDLESVKENTIDLSLVDTVQGVGVLVMKGLITQSRADYVLFYGDGPMPVPDDTPPA